MTIEERKRMVAARLGKVGWGAFFVWVGLCWLVPVELGPALLGVAGITLLAQAGRLLYGLPLEGFWVAAGVCFAIGGVAQLTATEFPLMPVLLVLVGCVLLFGGLIGRRRHQH